MKTTILTVAAVLATASVASAQSYAVRNGNNGTPAIYRHASTVQEGIQRGRADVIRAKGDYNYNTSLANINNQYAYSQSLDNSVKSVQTYFQRRDINRKARAYERGPRPTSQDLARYAKLRAPKRLTRYEYEPALKKLFWPAVLKHEMYAAERNMIDELMSKRTLDDSGLGTTNYRTIRQLTVQMQSRLKGQLDDVTPTEYVMGKNFLTGVELEAQTIALPEGLAVR